MIPKSIDETVEIINDVLFSDSRIWIEPQLLRAAVEKDIIISRDPIVMNELPTEAQIDELVTGGDDGEVDPDVVRMFPAINAIIGEQF